MSELTANEIAFIALGSNLGNSVALVTEAMKRLAELSAKPILKSSLWRTQPVDCPPGSPDFINAVAGIFPLPRETPESLLAQLQALEKEFGRVPKKVMNEARALDLDLISFGDRRIETSTLVLPHPRADQRAFVLRPLAEIAPGFVLPSHSKTVAQLLQTSPNWEGVERLSFVP